MCKKLSIFFCATLLAMTLTINTFAEGNLIKNGSFEDVQNGTPTYWNIYSYVSDEGASEFIIDTDKAYSDSNCVTIINNVENDSRYSQTVNAQPNKNYKLSCYIKAENIGDSGSGAILSVEGQVSATNPWRDTDELWEYVEMYVKTGKGINSFNVTVGVGGYGALSTGKASFDDVRVEEVDTIPDGTIVATVEMPAQDNSSSDTQSEFDSNTTSESEEKPSSNRTVWIILAVCILIAAAAIYYTFRPTSPEENTPSDASLPSNDNKDSTQGLEEAKRDEKHRDS
ncbi:MAG: hypothetical protein GX270_09585 [Clostridiaceae bacterium]|nr:hypothetical protein [Clostridiaceae bacterium]